MKDSVKGLSTAPLANAMFTLASALKNSFIVRFIGHASGDLDWNVAEEEFTNQSTAMLGNHKGAVPDTGNRRVSRLKAHCPQPFELDGSRKQIPELPTKTLWAASRTFP
ncbi:hypothetical protein MRX96_013252 [Rhipicephalus microplus]